MLTAALSSAGAAWCPAPGDLGCGELQDPNVPALFLEPCANSGLAPGTITRCQGLITLVTSSLSRNSPRGSSAVPALVKGREELAAGHA